MKKSIFLVLITVFVAIMGCVSINAATVRIDDDPWDTAAANNNIAAFECVATNVAAYQWYMVKAGDDPLNTDSHVLLEDGAIKNGDLSLNGVNSSILVVPAFEETDGCYFICKVKGNDGTELTSLAAQLTVNYGGSGSSNNNPGAGDGTSNDNNTVTPEKKGCGSVVSGFSAVAVLLCTALILKRKS